MTDTTQYAWLNGYKTKLVGGLSKTDTIINVANADELHGKLSGAYTYLTLTDGTATEIVKAEQFGTEIKITRAQENTTVQAFPAGACVKWEATQSAICAELKKCLEKENEDCGCE